MITYIFESALIWLILYLFYQLFLQKETYFVLNRIYLLFAVLAGIILPLLHIPLNSQTGMAAYTFPVQILIRPELEPNAAVVALNPTRTDWIKTGLLVLYLSGLFFSMARLGKNLHRILTIYRSGRTFIGDGHTEVILSDSWNPFSFFQWMFIPQRIRESDRYLMVKKHELAHIRQLHSLDILWLEWVQMVFWFNPVLRLFKKAIVQNHEYLADETSLAYSEKYEYGNLLLSFHSVHPDLFLGNRLNNSIIKNRIAMMYKRRSKPASQFKYLLVLPVVLILVVLFSCEEKEAVNTVTDQQPTELNMDKVTPPDQNGVFRQVEQMPRFPGCESVEGTEEDKQSCSNGKLMQYIGQNLKYPETARKNGLEGTVIAEFIINENGLIQDAKIARDIGDGCGDAVLKVINSMNEMEQKWTPGKQGGEYVKVQFSLPVKFKLDDKEK
jgi:TonB family protein